MYLHQKTKVQYTHYVLLQNTCAATDVSQTYHTHTLITYVFKALIATGT